MPRRPRLAGLLSLALAGVVAAATGLTVADAITGSDSAGQGARRHQHDRVKRTSWDPLTPISVNGKGLPGDGESTGAIVAPDNPAVVAFTSTADHLTDDDGNGQRDVFVVDHGTLAKLSGDLPCGTYLGVTAGPALSGSGDVVAYAVACQAHDGQRTTTLVAQDRTTGATQVVTPVDPASGVDHVVLSSDGHVLVWDQIGDVYGTRLDAGPPAPVLVSADVDGKPTAASSDPAVSSDGGCVAFASRSSRLVPGDVDGVADIFLRTGSFTPDPSDDAVVLISRAADGSPADGASSKPSLSGDCRRIAYVTVATNVVPGGGVGGLVVAERPSGTTVRVTVAPGGAREPVISADGGYVAFTGSDGPSGPVPTNFEVFDRAATPGYGTSIVAVDGSRVRVGFPPGFDLARVTGGSVEAGTLIDDQVVPLDAPDGRSNTNPLGTVGATLPEQARMPSATDLTDGPDLVSAHVVADDNSTPLDRSDDTTAVRFCFDSPVAAVAGPSRGDGTAAVATTRFLVQGYDSMARHASTDAALEPPGTDGVPSRCLRARFPRDVDVAAYTLAGVLDHAVADGTGRMNLKGSRHLDADRPPPRPGDITGPNLRGVRPDLVANQAVFTFDRILGTGPPVTEAAPRFHFVDSDGRDHAGRAVTAVDRKAATVAVEFSPDRDSLLTARRFVVLPGAVRNDGGGSNVEQSTDGDVPGPQLISAARVGSTGAEYDFTFSSPVTGPDAGRFLLAAEDGTTFPAASADTAGRTVVRISAPAVERFAGSIVLGIAEAGAVSERVAGLLTGRAGRGAPNAAAAKPIAVSAAAAGALSDGPDLVAVEPRPADHTVDYLFDQPVRDVHLLAADPVVPAGPTAVYLADLSRQTVERVSVDGAGRPLAGSSWGPSITAHGGIVAFVSSGLPGAGGTSRLPNVFVRNLLDSAVTPGSVDFGAVVVGARSATPTKVSVTNHGHGDLPVAVALTGNGRDGFALVDDGCSGRTLAPGETCSVGVVFTPSTAGVRTAGLLVTDDAPGSPHTVPLVGFADPAVPTVAVSPRVGRPGSVALVSGQGFPPGAHLALRLSAGPSLSRAVTADRDGRFRAAPLLVVSGHSTGPLFIEVLADRPRVSARVPFLVAPRSVQPAARRTPGQLPELRYRR